MTRAAAATIILLTVCAQLIGGQAIPPMTDVRAPNIPEDHGHRTWSLAQDIGTSGNQIGFNQGAEGVWYFMVSHTTDHNPQLYRFIREFNAPALPATGIVVPEGFSCWQERGDVLPDICFNFTDHPVALENFEVPARTAYLHPTPNRLAIVAWKSPVSGIVSISGSFADLDANCGNGVQWSIDRNAATLLSDDLENGAAQTFDLTHVRVQPNQVLYFIVDAKDFDHVCDSTALHLTISRGSGK